YVAIDDASVYWTSPAGGALVRVDDRGVKNPQNFIVGEGWPWDLAVDEANVYFTTRDAGAIVRAGKVDGGGRLVLADLADAAPPIAVAIDDTSVYVTIEATDAAAGAVVRYAKDADAGA